MMVKVHKYMSNDRNELEEFMSEKMGEEIYLRQTGQHKFTLRIFKDNEEVDLPEKEFGFVTIETTCHDETIWTWRLFEREEDLEKDIPICFK